MATGRGRLLQQHWLGLQALRLHLGGVGAAPGSDRFRKGPGVQAAAFRTPGKQYALGEGPCGRPCPHCPAWLDSMPSEILLKILSYLDAATLLCVGCVNRRFYHLASDKYNWRADSVGKAAVSMSLLSVEDREAGHWKKEYIMKRMASLKAALAQVLKPVNLYTGLPEKTKEALRISGVGWVIILREKSGREHVMEHVDLFINDSSVTVVWYGKDWPRLATLAALDLCGVMPLFTDWPKPPTKNGPRWCSLVAKYSLSDMTDSAVIGCDRFVRLFRLDPGLLVGLWKREEELAFVMANLHVSHLVERSTLGSATVPYELPPHGALLDDSPECGLRGYQLHVDLHSEGAFCLCSTFCNLFTDTVISGATVSCVGDIFVGSSFGAVSPGMCAPGPAVSLLGEHSDTRTYLARLLAGEGCIENGYVKLVVIHFQNSVEHLPLIGEVGLSWRTEVVGGCIKTSCIDYEDSVGAVHMELARIEETEEHFIVSLVLCLRLAKINRWFGTRY